MERGISQKNLHDEPAPRVQAKVCFGEKNQESLTQSSITTRQNSQLAGLWLIRCRWLPILSLRKIFRFDPNPIPVVSLTNLNSKPSGFTAGQKQRQERSHYDCDDTFLHVITSDRELEALRAVAQAFSENGDHYFASCVAREVDFRDDVNHAIRGYREIIARLDVHDKIIDSKQFSVYREPQ